MAENTKRRLGAAVGAGVVFLLALFTNWGFDPASWHPIDRLAFGVFLLVGAGMGATFPFRRS